MIKATKSSVCTWSLALLYLTVEISSLTVLEDQLVQEDAYHSADREDLKRASSFLPMRGRRDELEEDKRASSFQPMRGKKDDDDLFESYADDKRASSFMPMRGRKAIYGSEGGPLIMLRPEQEEELAEEKRGSGFMPMRGRRANSFMPMRGRKADLGQEGGKRASSFMPMRGRKNSIGGSGKRVGFLPMRGKKSDEEEDENEEGSDEVRKALEALASGGKIVTQEDKRGSNFFAMRGKRETQSHNTRVATKRENTFFPTRGKRSAAD